jgi:hypothetical protein
LAISSDESKDALALVIGDFVDARTGVLARLRSAIIDIDAAIRSGVSFCALACVFVDAVNACRSV